MAKAISVTTCAKMFMTNENKNNFGTKIHKYIENHLKTGQKMCVENEDEKKICLHFKEYLKDHPYLKLVECEKEIEYIYKNKKIVGKIDAVFKNINEPNEISIIDWKIKSDLSYDDNKSYSYIMNLYSKILQKEFPNAIIKMFLVLLHHHKLSYIIIPCSDIDYSLEELLDLSFNTN